MRSPTQSAPDFNACSTDFTHNHQHLPFPLSLSRDPVLEEACIACCSERLASLAVRRHSKKSGMVLDNDARGWIMAVVSGIGASATCIRLNTPGRLLTHIQRAHLEVNMHFSGSTSMKNLRSNTKQHR